MATLKLVDPKITVTKIEKHWWQRLGGALAEFFNPRDWVPSIPVVRKHNPNAQGYQTLGEALRGFKDD